MGTAADELRFDHDPSTLGISARSVEPPSRRLGVVQRVRLVKELLDTGDRLVVIAAPAGYGKTTTVTLWDDADERPFAWVHLDPVDDDPVHLVRHIAAALALVHPLDEATVRDLTGPGRAVDLDMLPALIRAFDAADPLVLVCDDVHLVTSPAALQTLDALLTHGPGHGQIVLVGRSVPALPLARRRMNDEVVELGADALALTYREADRLFEDAGIPLAEATVDELVRQTEGWPGGLHLAALALSRRDQPARAEAFSGRDRLVAEYLVEEVLDGLPPATVEFLEQSSILDAMNGRMLDGLLESEGSAQLLRELDQMGNRFLVPLDTERDWYRYHHLFGDMLRARLWANDPGRARALEQRASELLEQQGDPDGALRHAVAAGATRRAADLVVRHAAALVAAGRVAQLGRWLALLGPEVTDDLPSAAVASAWYGVATADPTLIQRASAAVARNPWAGPLADGSPSCDVAMATIRAIAGADGLPGVLRDTEIARDGGGPGVNPWWGVATAIRGTALAQLGEPEAARALLTESLPTLGGMPAFEAGTLAHLALLDLRDGQDDHADQRLADALESIDRRNLEGVMPVIPAFAIGALVHARRGREADAADLAAAARRMLGRLGPLAPRSALFCSLTLAEASLVLDDHDDAGAMLDRARLAAQREPSAVWLASQIDELARALEPAAPAASGPAVPLTSAEQRLIPYLATHLSLQEIAAELFISRNTAKSHSVAIYRKLGVSSRSAAVAEARRLGLLPDA